MCRHSIIASVGLELFFSISLVILLVVVILVGALDSSSILPSVKPVEADPSEFSGARAKEHLNIIAVQPHPWYNEENERVLGYILSHGNLLVSKYGTDIIETSVQNATEADLYNDYTGSFESGSIINVAFLIKGKQTGSDGEAIQVSSYYDGVPMGPAATDDGAGCAVMLELSSGLASRSASGDQLERDVLILFVDAEEDGLVGAEYWASGRDSAGNDISHPWSALSSFAINIEGSGAATSREMLIRSNSYFATSAYQKHAPHPKAFSLTEWLYKTISIGRTDSDIYWTQGIHLVDLVWVEYRWAYHTEDDNVDNVRSGSLQNCGNNVLSIVSGVSKPPDFPGRMPNEKLVESGVIQIGGTVGMSSDTVYFSLLSGSMIWMPFQFARVMYIVLAIVLGLTMPYLVGDQYVEDRAIDGRNSFTRVTHVCCSVKLAKASIRMGLMSLLNLLRPLSISLEISPPPRHWLGMVASVASFAAFGMWKSPSEEESKRRADWDGAIVAWGGIGTVRVFLSLFTVIGTAFLVYMPLRPDLCRSRWNRPSNPPGLSAGIDSNDLGRDQSCHRNDECTEEKQDSPVDTSAGEPTTDESKLHEQNGLDASVGVFYFYVTLLLLLGSILPDSAASVMWQPIFIWFASLIDAFLRRWIRNNCEDVIDNRVSVWSRR
ncbi:hypothetical protein ACHAWF_014776 [Thalassiosira exigua]